MLQDRRDNSPILDKLEVMGINLALNTKDTTNILEQLKTLNGKVIAHESRLQTQEGTLALTAESLAQIKKNEEKQDSKKNDWTVYFIKTLLWIGGGLFYYLLIKNGFPNFLH